MKHFVWGMVIVVCWPGLSVAQMTQPIRVFGEVLFHKAAIDGTVRWSDADVLGSEIDIDGTFGLKETNGWLARAGAVFYGAHELVLDYRRYHLSKQTTLSTSVQFGDFTLPLSLPVTPSLTFQAIGMFYGYRLINDDAFTLSIRPGIEWVEYEVGVEASLFGYQYTSETYTGEHTVPFFWVAGEYRFHPMLSLAGEMSGGWADEQVAYWGQAALKLALHPNIGVMVGYSRLWFKDESQGNLFDVALSGIVIGGQIFW